MSRSLSLVFSVMCGAILAGSVACSSPDLSGPAAASSAWVLTLNAHAVTLDTLAPYDTFRLVATTRDIDGNPLAGASTPTFTTSDSSVRVSADGVLTARAATTNVQVVAQLVYQGVRLTDTAYVVATASTTAPPAFHTLVLGVFQDDSITLATPIGLSNFYAPSSKLLAAVAEDALGQTIPGAVVALRTSVPVQAHVDSLTNTGTAVVNFDAQKSVPGSFWVYATATVYGVTKTDSLQLTLTNPLWMMYQVGPDSGTDGFTLLPTSGEQVISVGGVVWWVNVAPDDSLDVVFDDSSAAAADAGFSGLLNTGSGDITAFRGCATGGLLGCQGQAFGYKVRSRMFPRQGTFAWHSTRMNLSGRIHVH